MLKILVQTVFSLGFLTSLLIGKEIPIVKNLEIFIPYKEFSVLEFPFKIKGYAFTPFVYKKKKNSNEINKEPTFKTPKLEEKVNKQKIATKLKRKIKDNLAKKAKVKNGPISVTKGKNVFRLYPKKIGSTELLVWGYEKFPIMIKINVLKNKDKTSKLLQFVDLRVKTELAEKFESSSHDRIIIKITKALYLYQTPPGYKDVVLNEKSIFIGEEYVNKIALQLIRGISGKNYMGEEYVIKNTTQTETLSLKSYIFEDKGIYGITFLNNILTPGDVTRLFIVREKTR